MHLKNYRHFSYFIILWQIRIHKLNNKRLPQLPYSRFSDVIWGKKWNTPKQSSRWKYENQSVAIFTPCKVVTELFNKRNALLSLKTFWKIYDNKWHCIITRKKLAKHYFEHTLQIKFHTPSNQFFPLLSSNFIVVLLYNTCYESINDLYQPFI